ncbi:MAG TPA: hypothetical protein EYQ86_00265, partial [Bacteroidetes bacterium]|nr:hypothetical protein [Bacteroidota bacterium]
MATIIDNTIKAEQISNLEKLPKDVQDIIKASEHIYVHLCTLEGSGCSSWSAMYEYWSEDAVKEQKKYNPNLKVGY